MNHTGVVLVVLVLVALCGVGAGDVSSWKVSPKGKPLVAEAPRDVDFTAENGMWKIEGKFTLENIYDHEAMKLPSILDEFVKKNKGVFSSSDTTAYKEATQFKESIKPAHKTALSLRVLFDKKVVFSSYQGKGASFEKSELMPIRPELVDKFKSVISAIAIGNRADNILKVAIAKSMKFVATYLKEKTPSSSLPVALETNSRQWRRARFLEVAKNKLRARTSRFRYDVALSIGKAFNTPFGDHSGTTIMLIDVDSNVVIESWNEGNGGRQPGEDGMTPKCVHTGVVFGAGARPARGQWVCSTSYWPVYCPNGPNWNCNAQAKFQMNIADNPLGTNSQTGGPCASDCPAKSFSC